MGTAFPWKRYSGFLALGTRAPVAEVFLVRPGLPLERPASNHCDQAAVSFFDAASEPPASSLIRMSSQDYPAESFLDISVWRIPTEPEVQGIDTSQLQQDRDQRPLQQLDCRHAQSALTNTN
jgi:hypothetical protein